MTTVPNILASDAIDTATVSHLDMADLTEFKSNAKIRKGLRISATKTIGSLDSNLTDLAKALAVHDKLKNLIKDITVQDVAIKQLLLDNDAPDDHYLLEVENCDAYQDALSIAVQRTELEISSLKAARQAGLPSQGSTGGNQNSNRNQGSPGFNPNLSLPKLTLPVFYSNPLHYARFIAQFESIIDKTQYSDYQKFCLLEQSLSGEAAAVVKTPGIHHMTYPSARAALDAAYKDSFALKY